MRRQQHEQAQAQQQVHGAADMAVGSRLDALASRLAGSSLLQEQEQQRRSQYGAAALRSQSPSAATAAAATRLDSTSSGSPPGSRADWWARGGAAAATAQLAGPRLSPVRTSLSPGRLAAAGASPTARGLSAAAAAAAAVRTSGNGSSGSAKHYSAANMGGSSSSARRSLGFQQSTAVDAAVGAGASPTHGHLPSHAVYTVRAGSPRPRGVTGLSAARHTGGVTNRGCSGPDSPAGRVGSGRAGEGLTSPGRAAAAASGLAADAATDRYQALVREADAALQQLAACRRVADSAPAAAGSNPSGAGTAACVRSSYGNDTEQPRPHSASVVPTAVSSYRHRSDSSTSGPAAATRAAVGDMGAARAHASYSPRSFSKQLAASAVGAAAGRQPGTYSSLGEKQGFVGASTSCYSPLRGRPVSAGALGVAPAAVSAVRSPPGATAGGHMSRVLKGELQALDSDIAAAEASLQAAAQRLGAGQPPRQW